MNSQKLRETQKTLQLSVGQYNNTSEDQLDASLNVDVSSNFKLAASSNAVNVSCISKY